MTQAQRQHEKWIWLDLLGFDNTREDFGVAEYVDNAGFVPDAICLMLSSVDFVLLHDGMDEEVTLPPDFCSRKGHAHNQHRGRQDWTNHQVKGLIDRLHGGGTEVYLSVFTGVFRTDFHREWVTDHPEVLMVWGAECDAQNVNSLARLEDGAYYEDVFLGRLLRAITDYGFDGWHGADGYGPLSGPIYEVDFSDDMINQFLEARPADMPDVVLDPCGRDVAKLKQRADWIWRNRRRDWIDFWTDRWAGFWKKAVDMLHAVDKKAIINSAWTRAPFEALYRYGIDYRKIAATGVDAIVVETVAGGVALGSGGDVHHDYLAMIMLIKAHVPQTKLIFLHSVHDIVEQWDLLRHAPAVLEKEIYSLANVFHTRPDGDLSPCVDGFLVCLGDGLSRDEWRWLRERWDLAFAPPPRRTLGATLVWSEWAIENQIDDFTATRTWTTHRILFHLLQSGVPVQSVAGVDALDNVRGPILITNPLFFAEDDLKKALAYRNGPVITIGRRPQSLPSPGLEFQDVCEPNALRCTVHGTDQTPAPEIHADPEEGIPDDFPGLAGPRSFRGDLYFRKVSDSFLDACTRTLLELADCIAVSEPTMTWYHGSGDEAIGIMLMEQADGELRLALKNSGLTYAAPEVDLRRPIRSVKVLTPFPVVAITPQGSSFGVKVPPKGIVVLQVRLDG